MATSKNTASRRRNPGLMLIDEGTITPEDIKRRRLLLDRLRAEDVARVEAMQGLSEDEKVTERLSEPQLNALMEASESRAFPQLYQKTQRRHRENMERAVIRAELEAENPDLDLDQEDAADDLERQVDIEYARRFPQDPKVQRQYRKIEAVSASPSRQGLKPLVEVHARRQLPEAQELEHVLTRRNDTLGRNSDLELMRAVFECMIFEPGPVAINHHYHRFQGQERLTAHAYGYPARQGSNRNLSNVYEMLHAKLQTEDPDVCIKLMVQAVLRLRDELDDPDIGRYIAVDGTDVPAPRQQRGVSSGPAKAVEDRMLRRGIASASWSSHGPNKWWRGPLCLGIFDIKTNMYLGAGLFEGTKHEYRCLEEMLLKIHKYWFELSGERWSPEFIVGDALYDNDPTHRMLLQNFGIHLVCPRNGSLGREYEHYESNGTPVCAQHGQMKLKQTDNCVDAAKRNELGILPGETVDLGNMFHRWICVEPGCQVKEVRVYWKNGPRAYPFLPFCGEHSWRVAMRGALLRKRNVAEALIGQIKRRGIANGGMLTPRWVQCDREMEWLLYAAVLAHSFQRLAHLPDGTYGSSYAEMDGFGLLAPCEPPEELAA